jgi:hypothetical protein
MVRASHEGSLSYLSPEEYLRAAWLQAVKDLRGTAWLSWYPVHPSTPQGPDQVNVLLLPLGSRDVCKIRGSAPAATRSSTPGCPIWVVRTRHDSGF